MTTNDEQWETVGSGTFGVVWTQKDSTTVCKHFIVDLMMEEKARDCSDEWSPPPTRQQRHDTHLTQHIHIENWMNETLHRSILTATRGICAMVDFDHRELTLTLERYEGNLTRYPSVPGAKAAERRQNYQLFLLDTVVPQVCEQLVAIHACGLVHLDVKPDNILYRQEEGNCHIALTDLVCSLRQGEVYTYRTSPGFAPVLDKPYPLDYRYDMYSLGKSLLVLAGKKYIKQEDYLPRFSALLERLTGNYDDIPPPQTFAASVHLSLCNSAPYLPLVPGYRRNLSFTLITLLHPKYDEPMLSRVCLCIQLLLKESDVEGLLLKWTPGKRPLLDPDMNRFLEIFSEVMRDEKAVNVIRCFVESGYLDSEEQECAV